MESRLRALSGGYRRVLERFIAYPLWFGWRWYLRCC
jgi:hypothetical protein